MPQTFIHNGEARPIKAITDIPGFLREPGTGYMMSLADLGNIGKASVWAYRAIMVRATLLAGIPLVLERGYGADAETVEDHPLLLDTALGSGATAKIRALEADLCVYGKTYFTWDTGFTGAVLNVTRLNPLAVTPRFDPQDRTKLVGYDYKPAGANGAVARSYKPDEIVAIANLDWANDYGGLSPLAVAALAANADKNMLAQVEAFFKNGTMLTGMLTTDQPLQEPDVERIRASWRRTYEGVRNWFKTFISWGGVKFIPMAPPPKDLAMKELQEEVRTNICAAFGISPALIVADAKYSNAQEAHKSAYHDVVIPEGDFVCDELNRQLVHPLYGDEYNLRFDYSAIEALSEDKNSVYQRAGQALSAGARFADVMEMMGLEPPDDPELAERRYIPSNLTQILDKATQDAKDAAAEQAKAEALARLNAPKPAEEAPEEEVEPVEDLPAKRAAALADVRAGKAVILWGRECKTAKQVRAAFDAHWPRPAADPLAAAVAELRRYNDAIAPVA